MSVLINLIIALEKAKIKSEAEMKIQELDKIKRPEPQKDIYLNKKVSK